MSQQHKHRIIVYIHTTSLSAQHILFVYTQKEIIQRVALMWWLDNNSHMLVTEVKQ